MMKLYVMRLAMAAAGVAAACVATSGQAQTTNPCPAGFNPLFIPTPTNPSAFTCIANTSGTGGGAGSAGIYATEPRYGSPNSMQFQAVSVALDLFSMDDQEGSPTEDYVGDADTVGGAFTYFDAGTQHGQRYEGRYQHARRLGEGTRARVLIDAPIDILHANGGGGTAVYGTLSGGVELPAKPNWLLTPRAAYSNLQAGKAYFYDGEQIAASLTSRYKISPVGRGDLTIGNLIAYTRTINTFLAKQPGFTATDDWVFRNGLAYQLPIKKRLFGRQTSVRASYVFTYTTGSPGLAFKQIHELGLNIGVRTREAEQKNRFEQMRIGILYTHGKNEFSSKAGYDSVTATFGYRF